MRHVLPDERIDEPRSDGADEQLGSPLLFDHRKENDIRIITNIY